MAAGSRITVDIGGSSADLLKATDAAADALKGLGDVLKKQTDLALDLSDSTVKANSLLSRSYEEAATVAGAASDKTIAAFQRQGAVVLDGSKQQAAALAETADAARASSDVQVRASEKSATASKAAAETHVSSAKKSEQAYGSASSGLTKAGKIISLGLLGAAAASVDLAVKFQSNTLRMQTQAGATTKQLALLRQGILAMAGQVGDTPNQLADGMYHVVSSMNAVLAPTKRVSTELAVLRSAAELAKIGGSDLEDTTYALASAMNALHAPASQVNKIAGEINATVGAGDMTMQDFVDSLKSGLLPAAAQSGISLQSVGAAMAVMGDMGMRGALAGTRLRMAIALISSPSEAAAKVLQTLGLSATQATSTSAAMASALEKAGLRTTALSSDLKKPDGILAALEDLDSHLRSSGLTASGAAAVLDKAFGGARTGATITLLAQNTDRLNTKFHQIGDSANQFSGDWQRASHTTSVELQQIEGGALSLGTRIGTALLPKVDEGIHDFEEFADWLGKGSTAAHELEIAVGALATVAIGSYLISKLTQVIKLMREFYAFTSNPMGLGSAIKNASSPTALGAGPAAAVGGGTGIGMVSGARGFEAPGSIANPIVVAMEAGEYAGLSSMGAAGTVGTEEKVAQAESGAVENMSKGGVMLPSGVKPPVTGGVGAAEATAAAGATGVEETAVTGGALASLKGGLNSAMSGALKGGLIVAGGVMASQLAKSAIGGKTGQVVGHIGTDASIGAGGGAAIGSIIPGLGTMVGGLIGGVGGAIVGGLTTMFHTEDFGQKIAGKVFSGGFGGAQAPTLSKEVATALDQLKQYTTTTKTEGGPRGARMQVPVQLDFSKLDPVQQAKAEAAANTAGTLIAKQLEAGWDQYKFQSTPIMFDQLRSKLASLPPQAQDAATKSAVAFVDGLQKQGRIASGSAADFLKQVEGEFPGFTKYMGMSAGASVQAFNKALNFQDTEQNVGNALQQIENDFSPVQQVVSATAGTIQDKTAAAVSALEILADGTGKSATQAKADLADLRTAAGQSLDALVANVSTDTGSMTQLLKAGSQAAYQVAYTNYGKLVSTVEGDIKSGVTSTKSGMGDIGDALNAMLKAMGEPKIDFTGVANNPGAGGASLSTLKGISKAAGKATGGWVGNEGEKGADTVNAVLGRGEAVLKHQDQAIVNQALSQTRYGSLGGVFAATSGQKHWMASGGFAGRPGGVTESYAQLEGLWDQAGGPKNMAPLMAAIAEAESSGSSTAYNSSGASGLWQILGVPFPGNVFDPLTNARMAVAKYKSQGLGAWTTYTSGAYKQFLHGNVPANLSGIGGGSIAAPSVTGTGPIADIVQAALSVAAGAANSYLGANSGTGAGGGAGALGGNAAGGTVTPNTAWNPYHKPIASWIVPVLNWAAANGWHGTVVSGYRTPSEQMAAAQSYAARVGQSVGSLYAGGNPLNSNHLKTVYPGGAVDVDGGSDQQLISMLSRYKGLESLVGGNLGPGDPYHFSHTGFSGGGFTDDAKFPSKVIGPSTLKPPKVPKAPKGLSTGLSAKDMQGLAKVGGQINSIEGQIATLSGTYSSDTTLFPPQEASAQYLNPDGSTNAAGFAKVISDDQTLLGIDNQLLGLYNQEVPIVSAALTQWLGNQGKTNSKIDSNKAKIARNKLQIASLRKAALDLTKPGPNTVQTIEDQISKTRLGWSKTLLAAEKAKARFDQAQVPKELGLEQAVINAAKAKLGYSVTAEADQLKQGVLGAESKQQGYSGTDTTTKQSLSDAVDQARNQYTQFLLNQAPIKAALTANSTGASLQLRQYLQSEKPTQAQLTNAVTNAHLSEQSALLPLQEALYNAKVAQQKKAQQTKVKKFNLSQQLQSLTTQDTKLGQADTSMSAILSGAGGGTSTNATVNILETVAAKLGMIEWGSGGNFASINTAMPGEIVSVTADIQSLNNSIGAAQANQTGSAATPQDQTQQIELLEEVNLQLSEAYSLSQAQGGVLAGMIPEIPSYDRGGPIIGDQIAQVHDQEFVVPRGGALVKSGGSSGPTTVELHQHNHGSAAALMSLIDQRIQHPDNVRVISKMVGQRTSMLRNAPGGGRH